MPRIPVRPTPGAPACPAPPLVGGRHDRRTPARGRPRAPGRRRWPARCSPSSPSSTTPATAASSAAPPQELTRYPAAEFLPPDGELVLLLEDGVPVAGRRVPAAPRSRDRRGQADVDVVGAPPPRPGPPGARRAASSGPPTAATPGMFLTTGPRQPEAKALYLRRRLDAAVRPRRPPPHRPRRAARAAGDRARLRLREASGRSPVTTLAARPEAATAVPPPTRHALRPAARRAGAAPRAVGRHRRRRRPAGHGGQLAGHQPAVGVGRRRRLPHRGVDRPRRLDDHAAHADHRGPRLRPGHRARADAAEPLTAARRR